VCGAALVVWSYWRAKRASGTVPRFDRGSGTEGAVERRNTDVRREMEDEHAAGCHYYSCM
jgi:hypothetical protein